MSTYKIKQGDTLSKIAQENGTTVEELAKINNISDPNKIYAGQNLMLTANDNVTSTKLGDVQGGVKTNYSNKDLSKYDNGFQISGDPDYTTANNKKTGYQNEYDTLLNAGHTYSNEELFQKVMQDWLNRPAFSYDLNGDALYQQYKDKYIQQGKMAMQDTMGQAAAMTGGYGNSYAATVGNQAYQASLENLNDIVPELYQLAYDKYNQEGQDMLNKYSMLSDDRNTEYGKYMDKLNLLGSNRDYYSDEENNIYNRKYGEYINDRAYDTDQYWNETEFGYTQERDNKADARTDAYAMIQAGIMPSDELLEAAGLSKEDAQQISEVYKGALNSGSGSGSSGSGSGGTKEEEEPKDYFDYSEEEHNKKVEENGGSYYTQTLTVLKQMKASGKTNGEVSAYLNEVVGNGYITRSEYMTLYNKYRDNKL